MRGKIDKQLRRYEDQIIWEAIKWEMKERGDFDWDGAQFVRLATETRVSGPMAGGKGGVVTHGESHGGRFFKPFDANALFNEIKVDVRGAFRPWYDLPDTVQLRHCASKMKDAAEILTTDSSADSGSLLIPTVAWSELDDMIAILEQMHGDTIFAFNKQFTHKIRDLVRAQCAVSTVLAYVLSSEQHIFEAAERDVMKIARDTLTAMKARGGDEGHGLKIFFTVVAGVTAAASIFVAAPIAGPIAGMSAAAAKQAAATAAKAAARAKNVGDAAKVTSIVNSFVSAGAGTGGSERGGPLGGSSWNGVMKNTGDALRKLNSAITLEEEKLDGNCRQGHAQVHDGSTRGRFNLRTANLMGETNPGKLGVRRGDDDLEARITELKSIGNVTMKNLSEHFMAASNAAAGAVDSGAWQRIDPVGDGADGAYASWRMLHDDLREMLDDTKWELLRGGEQLAIAAGLIEGSDEDSNARLKVIKGRLEDHRDKYGTTSPASRKDYSG